VRNDLPRENGWTLAEHASDAIPDKTYQVLSSAQARAGNQESARPKSLLGLWDCRAVGDRSGDGRWDFFVSYTQADLGWAEWVAWELEDAGYRVIVQVWDMPVGANWAEVMSRAASTADRTVAVVSPAYLESEYGTVEWLAAFAQDPLGRAGKLVPVKVDPFPWPAGLLGPIVGIDLSGLEQAEAAVRLRSLVASRPGVRSKPADRPVFPGLQSATKVTGSAQVQLGGLVAGGLPRRPPAFQERAAVGRVAEIVEAGGPAVVCALSGGRGVGKTQTAAAYARRRLDEGYPLVVWTSGESPQSLLADYAAAAEQLGVADPDGDSERSAVRLAGYLQELAVPSVLVIDNAVRQPGEVGLAWLEPLLPTVGRCEVVITSTDQGFGEFGGLVEVGVFERAQSVAYLTARTGVDDPGGADHVAEALGDLPAAGARPRRAEGPALVVPAVPGRVGRCPAG
jgi:TIR domain-containing protein